MRGVSPTVENGNAGQADDSKAASKEFSVPVRVIESPVEADARKERENKSDQHEADDLAAQRKAADAAWKGAVASEGQISPAWWQVGIASIGTLLLLYTLWLTRESLRITRETSKRQLRAYLAVSGCSLEEIPVGFVVTAEIRNSGQTPAFRVRHMSESFAEDYPLGGNKPHPIPLETHSAPVGAGDQTFCVQRLFTEDRAGALANVMAGKLGLWIQGTVFYDDCFGEPHTLKFRYVFGGRIANSGGLLLHADIEGNEAD